MTLHVKDDAGVWRKVSQPKLKLTGAWRDASAVYTKVNGEWREVWPNGSGAVRIVGPTYQGEGVKLPEPAWGATGLYYPAGCVRYDIAGDKGRIYSAKVELKYTPTAPKSPKEQIISWDVTREWGIYMVVWRVDASTTKYYYAGMTHDEAAAIVAPKYAVLLWSPQTGGRFAPMPVCFDVSGMTVPVRDDAAGGLDAHSGYAPFPPGRSAIRTSDGLAVSLTDDITVTNGYTDQGGGNGYYGYSAPNMTLVTITLRDVNGTTLASWGPTALPYASYPTLVPGLGIGPTTFMAARQASPVSTSDLYWPEEWRGLFDNIANMDVRFGRIVSDGNTAGSAEWWVFDQSGERIGDFKLALRKGITDNIEIHGVNLKPDLVGMGIMKVIVHHGTVWSPTRFVSLLPPNQPTYDVMRSWGWTKLEDAPHKSKSAAFYKVFDPRQKDRYLIYDTHIPMYNRFSELGLPSLEEVVQW